ncbi:nucleotide pyrophosphohydrolase [Goodfellowiella coeruleoviolacea]|uniref:NTP pyrophosphatase, house-cleaning of non-canonical NTPs n=1 Tax=Goodfellowiella coeruleoviolacea TaxID=334858 RepID=A0AAE3KH04_9PSEU|nr:nucleotide pyrophosphohydrolase [Goodfellowiella coeruleoviolacea]MCP2166790.1 NTP pyrophosphatase, house-cleaning of non-canonical NTPs [Goodfellowiella coeruleoviolacea]
MGEFEELRVRLADFAAARQWEPWHTPRNLALALTGEVGELVSELQWLTDEEVRAGLASGPLRDRVADEVADVLLYLVKFADACGLDLLAEAHAKIDRNEVRFPPEPAARPEAADPADNGDTGGTG